MNHLPIKDAISQISKTSELGRNQIYRTLRNRGIFTPKNLPVPYYVHHGYFSIDTKEVTTIDGKQVKRHRVKASFVGQELIKCICKEELGQKELNFDE